MTCFTPVRGRRMRVTRVNECCGPVYGECSQVVSDGFVSVEFSPQTSEGEEIEVRNANGDICVAIPACTSMTGIEVNISFCNVDTDMFAIMTGIDPIQDPDTGEGIGFDIADISCDTGFALELWTGIHSEQACGEQGEARYGYLVLPCLSGGVLNDFTIEDGAVTFGVTATARANHGWGEGPYDVQMDGGAAGPLNPPLDSDRFGRMIVTTVPPPEAGCGCLPLDPPEGGEGADFDDFAIAA